MVMLINPGSNAIPKAGNGWTNTKEQAESNARAWLESMWKDGIDVVLLPDPAPDGMGRWTFLFQHTVTGVVRKLDIHGIDNLEAYKKDGHIFDPRVYWKGSSSEEPTHDDFLRAGYRVVTRIEPDPAL